MINDEMSNVYDACGGKFRHDYGYFDGSCEPVNPGGQGGCGFALYEPGGVKLADGHGVMRARPDMTCNVAEYAAAGAAVKRYRELGRSGPLLLMGDSKLVVLQMKEAWRAKRGAYVPVHHRLKRFLADCPFQVQWEWIPRHINATADELSRRGLPRRPR